MMKTFLVQGVTRYEGQAAAEAWLGLLGKAVKVCSRY